MATSAWWHPQTWAQAHDTYDADRRTRRQPPRSFIEWIHEAIEQHAAQGAAARARLRVPARPEASEEEGLRRSHPLRQHTRQLLDQARVDDRELGREVSQSAWIYEAVALAIRDSERRARRVRVG